MTTTASDVASSASGRRLIIIAIILAVLVGVPFLAKPFHIDDTVVLAIAQNITHHPLRPLAGSINWFGDPRPIFHETTNPPLVSYYLAPLVALFGFAEIPLHLAMLLFLIVLAVSLAVLSRRFTRGSVWPVLFVMLSPAVVVSNNVMRDVPLAALSAAAVALFVIGVDQQRRSLLFAGSIVVGLAIMTKYSGAVLVPALACYALLQRRGRDAFWLLIPLVMVGAWALENQLVHHRVHLAYLMAERRNEVPPADRFYATWVIVGSCLFLLPSMLVDAVRRRRFGLVALALGAAGLVFFGAWRHNDGPPPWQFTLWETTGVALTVLLLVPGLAATPRALSRDYSDGADTLFLALWAGGVVAFSILFAMFQAVRHLIPAIAPLALLGVRLLFQGGASRWRGVLLGVFVGAQAIVAFTVAAADYEYAATYRDFATKARERLPRDHREIWFSGNWGWQRYGLSSGFTLVAEHGRLPRVGDLILIPDRVHKGPLPERLDLDQIEEKTYHGRIPIHTMDGNVGASFYSVTRTSVPYVFTRDRTLETFRVFRVKAIEPEEPSS